MDFATSVFLASQVSLEIQNFPFQRRNWQLVLAALFVQSVSSAFIDEEVALVLNQKGSSTPRQGCGNSCALSLAEKTL